MRLTCGEDMQWTFLFNFPLILGQVQVFFFFFYVNNVKFVASKLEFN